MSSNSPRINRISRIPDAPNSPTPPFSAPQHGYKWRLDGSNRPIGDFQKEDVCRGFLAELRQHWHGKVHWNETPLSMERLLIEACLGKMYEYTRVDHDCRPLELKPDRTIGRGAGGLERTWTITTIGGVPTLFLFSEDSPTCGLVPQNGAWVGRWYRHERMPIRLEPLAPFSMARITP